MDTPTLDAEVAGLMARLRSRMLSDPAVALMLQRDTEAQSKEDVLRGIEDAVLGLVKLHIQVRRGL